MEAPIAILDHNQSSSGSAHVHALEKTTLTSDQATRNSGRLVVDLTLKRALKASSIILDLL